MPIAYTSPQGSRDYSFKSPDTSVITAELERQNRSIDISRMNLTEKTRIARQGQLTGLIEANANQLKQFTSIPHKDRPFYQEALKAGKTAAEAMAISVNETQKISGAFEKQERLLEQQRLDLMRKESFGGRLAVLGQSFAQGVEMVAAPFRLGVQGESAAMAFQEAANTLSWYAPDNVFDKYLQMAAQNAAPMGVVIGAAMLGGGIGVAASGAFMAAYTGTDSYLNLRRQGAPHGDAVAGATAVGIMNAAIEMFTGKALVGIFGKLPVVKNMMGSAMRPDRIAALRGVTGKIDDIGLLGKNTTGKLVDLRGVDEVLKKYVGENMGALQMLARKGREAGMETVAGGIEEWLQQGIQLGIEEATLTNNGLDGVMPRDSEGNIDVGAVLANMNDAFIAGAILEGGFGVAMGAGFGVAMGAKSFKSDLAKANFMANAKAYVGEMTTEVDAKGKPVESGGVNTFSLRNASNNVKDFAARFVGTRLIQLESAARKKNGNKEITVGDRQVMAKQAFNEMVEALTANPIQTFLLDHADMKIGVVIPGKLITLESGGRTISIVKSDGLAKDDEAQFKTSPDGEMSINVGEDVWKKMQEKGLTENVIALNLYNGSTFAHEFFHEALVNLPADEQTKIMDEIGIADEDIQDKKTESGIEDDTVARHEILAENFERYQGEKTRSPVKSAFMDAFARIQVAIRGKGASPDAKARILNIGVSNKLKTGNALNTSQIGQEGILKAAGRTISNIGGKVTDSPIVGNARTAIHKATASGEATLSKSAKVVKNHSMNYRMSAAKKQTVDLQQTSKEKAFTKFSTDLADFQSGKSFAPNKISPKIIINTRTKPGTKTMVVGGQATAGVTRAGANINPQHLVDWIAESYNVPKESDQGLDFYEFGSQDTMAQTDETAEDIDTDIDTAVISKEDIVRKEVVEKTEGEKVIDETLTAENIAREILYNITEALNPGMSRQEILQKFGDSKAGAIASPSFIIESVLNFDPNAYPFKYQANRNLLGQAISEVLAKYELLQNATTPQTNTLGVSQADINTQLDLVDGLIEGLDPAALFSGVEGNIELEQRYRNLVDLNDKFLDYKYAISEAGSTELTAKLAEYIKGDPDGTKLSQAANTQQDTMARLDQTFSKSRALIAKNALLSQSLLQTSDAHFGQRDMRIIKCQIDTMRLTRDWNKIFGIPDEMAWHVLAKNLIGELFGKSTDLGTTLAEAHELSRNYQLAAVLALNDLNTENPVGSQLNEIKAIEANIARLETIKKRTIREDADLATYKRYLSVMPLVTDIVNGKGEYGQKVLDYIKGPYKKITDANWKMFTKNAPFQIGEKVEYYSPRLFRIDSQLNLDMSEIPASLTEMTGRLKGRKVPDLSYHFANGSVLRYESFLTSQLAGSIQAANALANYKVIHESVDSGMFRLDPKEGFTKVKGAEYFTWNVNGETYATHEDAVAALNDSTKEPQRIPHDVYAPTHIAKHMNTINQESKLRKDPFFNGLLAANAKLKALRIMWALFHRRAFIWSAMVGGPAAPGMSFELADFIGKGNLWGKIKSAFDYNTPRQLGIEAMNSYNPEMFALIYHGMTGFRIQDVGAASLQYKTRIEEWLGGDSRSAQAKAAKHYADKMSGVTHRLQTELFSVFGNALKFTTAMRIVDKARAKAIDKITAEKAASKKSGDLSPHYTEYANIFKQKGKPKLNDYYSATEEEIYRSAAGFANADFGGLHHERMGISKTTADTMRLLLLGPDWTMSNVITALKLWKSKNPSGDPLKSLTSNSAVEQEMYKMFWLSVMGRSLALATVINLLMAGLDDDSLFENYAKAAKEGKFRVLQADISPLIHLLGGDKATDHYLNTVGHPLDMLKLAKDPLRTGYHKSSTVLKPVLEAVGGFNYAHKRPSKISQIGTEGLNTWNSGRRGPISPSETPAFVLSQAIQTLPIQLKNMFELFSGEENVITSVLESGTGLELNRTYPSRTQKKSN